MLHFRVDPLESRTLFLGKGFTSRRLHGLIVEPGIEQRIDAERILRFLRRQQGMDLRFTGLFQNRAAKSRELFRVQAQHNAQTAERQNELTRRIQRKIRDAVEKNRKVRVVQSPISMFGAPDVEDVLPIDRCRTVHSTAASS
jgi:hypothetical protein